MNDCPSAEFRDRLPDLLHERLDPLARAAVVAHVASCADCRSELALLAELREALGVGTPHVRVERIVAALPARRRARPLPTGRRRPWADWRVAAAIVVLLAGGTSVATLIERGDPGRTLGSTSDSAVASAAISAGGPGGATSDAPATRLASGTPVELAIGGGLSDLDEGELRSLLTEIERLDELPAEEPEPALTTVPSVAPEES